MARQFTLGKNERLKSRKSIERLFSEGKKFVITSYRVIYKLVPAPGDGRILFGTAVSAKNFRKAVDRNRIKRLTREAYRLQKTELQGRIKTGNNQLHVFFIYTAKELPDYSEVLKKMAVALDKLDKLIQQ